MTSGPVRGFFAPGHIHTLRFTRGCRFTRVPDSHDVPDALMPEAIPGSAFTWTPGALVGKPGGGP